MSFPHRDPSTITKELFESCAWQEAGLPDGAAYKAAYYLFSELDERVGINRARWLFRHFGRPPSQRRLNEIKNYALLDRLDGMKDKKTGLPSPNILKLANELAKANQTLPVSERRSAGSTDVHALEKHIRDIVKKRKRGLEKRTWRGPVTHEQAVRHFGAKKVETFSKKT